MRHAFRGGTGLGWLYAGALLIGGTVAIWRMCSSSGEPFVAPASIPPFAWIGLGTFGLVGFSLGMLNARRFQRAEDLVRELTLVREPMHPDYREMMHLRRGWTVRDESDAMDPRWVDKHERTLKTIARLREYRQLFIGVPPFAVLTTLSFTVLVCISIVCWFLTLEFKQNWVSVGNLLVLAITVGVLIQLLGFLWRVAVFANRGTQEKLDQSLGVPSWYQLLDVAYLADRMVPFATLVANHEAYLALSRASSAGADQWVVSLQLPLPLRGWEWRCRVQRPDGTFLSKSGWEKVNLSAPEADRFFQEPGTWLEVPVARWSCDCLGPSAFGQVKACLELRCPGDSVVLRLTIPGSGESWYGARHGGAQPLRYPWYAIEYVPAGLCENTLDSPLLIRPQDDNWSDIQEEQP